MRRRSSPTPTTRCARWSRSRRRRCLPPAPEPPNPKAPPEPAPSISDMVERIEQLKQHRAPRPAGPRAAAAPPPRRRASDGRLFEWESDASGHIAWVEGAPRGALVGRPLGGEGVGLLERRRRHGLASATRSSMSRSRPARRSMGTWSATGVPAFDPATGRFLGYRGLARRTDGAAPRPEQGRARPRCAARNGPRDQDAAERDHRLCRDHRRPISRAGAPPLSRARGEHRRAGAAIARGGRGPRLRRQAARRPRRGAAAAARGCPSCCRRSPPTSSSALPPAAGSSRSTSTMSATAARCRPKSRCACCGACCCRCAMSSPAAKCSHRGDPARRDVPGDDRPPAPARRPERGATGRSVVRPGGGDPGGRGTARRRARLRAAAGARAGQVAGGSLAIDEHRITLELPALDADRSARAGLLARRSAAIAARGGACSSIG
jgi:hypothetical protein